MAQVTGPVSTLPGAVRMLRDLPPPSCDNHPDRQAEFLVQGETDSMGAEWIHACGECRANITEHLHNEIGQCDLCSSEDVAVRNYRDLDEGSCGPVYKACQPCRDRAHAYFKSMED